LMGRKDDPKGSYTKGSEGGQERLGGKAIRPVHGKANGRQSAWECRRVYYGGMWAMIVFDAKDGKSRANVDYPCIGEGQAKNLGHGSSPSARGYRGGRRKIFLI